MARFTVLNITLFHIVVKPHYEYYALVITLGEVLCTKSSPKILTKSY
jgi:hypothetical protein